MQRQYRNAITILAACTFASLGFSQGMLVSPPTGKPADGAAPIAPPPSIAGQPVPGTVAKLDWMAGCWEGTSERDGAIIKELWQLPRHGNLQGMGSITRDERIISWEAMRLYDDADSVKAWQRPSARAEFTMVMEKFADGFASFAITEGDTTTRLSYAKRGADTLALSFRLIKGEKRMGMDLNLKRTDCAGWIGVSPAPAATGVSATPVPAAKP